jgi:hypothetical protein
LIYRGGIKDGARGKASDGFSVYIRPVLVQAWKLAKRQTGNGSVVKPMATVCRSYLLLQSGWRN